MLKIVCLVLFIATVSAGIPFEDCGHSEMTNVTIIGCTTSPCTFHKGIGDQDSAKAEWSLHALRSGLDLDFATLIVDFDRDGCKHTACPVKRGTACPVKRGTAQRFSYRLTVPNTAPAIDADIKARLIGDSGDLFCGIVQGDLQD